MAYQPDTSWLHGKYHTFDKARNRIELEIHTGLPYVAIGSGYFCQGEEAEEPIKDIHTIWLRGRCSVKTAIVKYARLMGIDLLPKSN